MTVTTMFSFGKHQNFDRSQSDRVGLSHDGKVRQRKGGLMTALARWERRTLYFVLEKRRRASPSPSHSTFPNTDEESKRKPRCKNPVRGRPQIPKQTQYLLNLCVWFHRLVHSAPLAAFRALCPVQESVDRASGRDRCRFIPLDGSELFSSHMCLRTRSLRELLFC